MDKDWSTNQNRGFLLRTGKAYSDSSRTRHAINQGGTAALHPVGLEKNPAFTGQRKCNHRRYRPATDQTWAGLLYDVIAASKKIVQTCRRMNNVRIVTKGRRIQNHVGT